MSDLPPDSTSDALDDDALNTRDALVAELVEIYRSTPVWGVGDDAKQETVRYLLRKIQEGREPSGPKLRAWYLKIAEYRDTDELRRRTRVTHVRCSDCEPGRQLACGTCQGRGWVSKGRLELVGDGSPGEQGATSPLERPSAADADATADATLVRLSHTKLRDAATAAHQRLLVTPTRQDPVTRAVLLEVLRQVAAGATSAADVFDQAAQRIAPSETGADEDADKNEDDKKKRPGTQCRDHPELREIVHEVFRAFDPRFDGLKQNTKNQKVGRVTKPLVDALTEALAEDHR